LRGSGGFAGAFVRSITKNSICRLITHFSTWRTRPRKLSTLWSSCLLRCTAALIGSVIATSASVMPRILYFILWPTDGDTCPIFGSFSDSYIALICVWFTIFFYIFICSFFFVGFCVFSRQLEFRSRTALAVDWGLFFQWKNCLRASINRALECVSVCIAHSRIHTHTLTGQRTKNQMRTLVAAESSLSLQFSGDNKNIKHVFYQINKFVNNFFSIPCYGV